MKEPACQSRLIPTVWIQLGRSFALIFFVNWCGHRTFSCIWGYTLRGAPYYKRSGARRSPALMCSKGQADAAPNPTPPFLPPTHNSVTHTHSFEGRIIGPRAHRLTQISPPEKRKTIRGACKVAEVLRQPCLSYILATATRRKPTFSLNVPTCNPFSNTEVCKHRTVGPTRDHTKPVNTMKFTTVCQRDLARREDHGLMVRLWQLHCPNSRS